MTNRPSRETHPAASKARGRTASAAELRSALASAPPPFLAGALENPELGPDEVLLFLRNRSAPAALLARVGRDTEWTRLQEVKLGLVRHSNTPPAIARSLAAHLYPRDLAEIAEDVRVRPVVRRLAEEILKASVAEMTLGARISLARRCSRALISVLRDSAEVAVLRALLGNGRLVEADAVMIASGGKNPVEVLRMLALNPVWGVRRAVRLALLRNPRTPVPAALGLIRGMSRQDLASLAEDREAPRIVRVGAERRLGDGPGG
ncbi:MAG: hypothetical protein LAO51_17300 [Acidobacteriia bacterium]|nr:hypothetical protein [Terriglobia bacterium]